MPIFADYHRTVIGYHGTRREKALAIVSGEGLFSPSAKGYDWLGHGIYFWEYAPHQAWAWARQRYKTEKIAVLASMIRLGACLDLLDPRNAKDLVEVQKRFVKDTEIAKSPSLVTSTQRNILTAPSWYMRTVSSRQNAVSALTAAARSTFPAAPKNRLAYGKAVGYVMTRTYN